LLGFRNCIFALKLEGCVIKTSCSGRQRSALFIEWREKYLSRIPSINMIYKIGLCIGLLIIPVALVSGVLGVEENVGIVFSTIIYTSVVIWGVAFLVESYTILERLSRNKLFLVLLGGLSFALFKLSEISSDHFVNALTGIDPGLLPKSSSALVALFLPLQWLYIVALAMMPLTIFFMLRTVVATKEGTVAFLGRIVAAITVMLLATYFGSFLSKEDSFVYMLAKEIVIAAEYFPNNQCANIFVGERVADINRGWVSVYSPELDRFRSERCLSEDD
jgi:hypothetical protein